MKFYIRSIIIVAVICFSFLPARAQVSFKIDSLVFYYSGELGRDPSWENKVLYHRGPDVLIYGALKNNSDSTCVLEYVESDKDNLTILRELQLFVFYHYLKDYYFIQDPLHVTDIMSYPFWNGMGLPVNTTMIQGKNVSYSIIQPGESIPLAFETLAIPEEDAPTHNHIVNHCQQKRTVKYQEKVSKAICSSIKIIPIVHDYTVVPEKYIQLMDFLSHQPKDDFQFDYESSVPQFFLDIKPSFIDGGNKGFSLWLKERLTDIQPQLTEKEFRAMVTFVVSKEGDIVYCSVLPIDSPSVGEDTICLLKDIFLKSPKWKAGILHDNAIDSRITLWISVGHDGIWTIN